MVTRRIDVGYILRQDLVPQDGDVDHLGKQIELGRCNGHIGYIGCVDSMS